MKKVFISHATNDRELVEAMLLKPLQEAGIGWWYSPSSIEGGTEWEREILQGLRSCSHFILAMTPDAAASPWVRSEVHWAVNHRFDQLLPVLLKPVDIEEFHLRLISKQYFDLTTAEGSAKLAKVFRSAKSGGEVVEEKPTETGGIDIKHIEEAFGVGNIDFFDDLFGKQESVPKTDRVLGEAIGIEVKDEGVPSVMRIFDKGTELPSEHRLEFSTFEDNQEAIDVKLLVVSGELEKEIVPMSAMTEVEEGRSFSRRDASEFRRLGCFSLAGLQPRLKGVPRVDVTFHLNEFGELNVSAMERETNHSASGVFDQLLLMPVPATDDKVVVECPRCQTAFRVPGSLRLRATCPGCQSKLEIDQGQLV